MIREGTPVCLAMLLCACGPGSVASSNAGGGSGSSDAMGDSESGTSESTVSGTDESETDDPNPTTLGFVPGDDFCGPDFWCTPACDIYLQDCPAGEKCTAYAGSGGTWDASKCVPVLGELGPGEPCSYDGRELATDDCDATSMCYDGLCRSFCAGSSDDPSCASGLGCSAGGDSPLALCLERCDPLAQACATGSCYWQYDEFLCNPGGELEVGEACGFFNDCSPGSACVEASFVPGCVGTACCAPLCDLDQGDCASLPGTECVAWYEPGQAPAGLELVGVCVNP